MRVVQYNNKSCLDFYDEYGEFQPFQMLIVGSSGSGKDTWGDAIKERIVKATNAISITLYDPKNEAEGFYGRIEPIAKYHLDELRKDRIKKSTHDVTLWHPYSHNISKKGFLPNINFYTLSIKDMTRSDWSILAESDSESESIKLLERVSESLPRNGSLFDFLHEIERLTEGKKDKKRAVPDPKNWFLKSGGGTSKSVKQVGNMLSSFEKNYFLRKDTCPYKMNWEEVLLKPGTFHLFLTNWVDNPKLKNFLVECLIGQIVREAQRLSNLGKLKVPILLDVPELINVVPDDEGGSAVFVAKALAKNLVSMRSKANGISFLANTQIWSKTSSIVRSAFNQTFFGRLNPEDARVVFKANSYTANERELFKEVEEHPGRFVWFKNEDFGTFQGFMPSHMHKEIKYNWIQMYKKHFGSEMKRYDDLVAYMKKEYNEEYKKAQSEVMKEESEIDEQEKKKKEKKETNTTKSIEPKLNTAKEYLYKRAFELHQDGLSDRKIAEELGIKSHKTAKKYYLKYQNESDKPLIQKEKGDFIQNFGEGILPEEIESNFGNENSTE